MSEVEKEVEKEVERIEISPELAFNLRIQEFNKQINEAKFEASKLEKEKSAFIYNSTVQNIKSTHDEMKANKNKEQKDEEVKEETKEQSK